MIKRFIKRLSKGQTEDHGVQVQSRKMARMAETVEHYSVAAALAEGGMVDSAQTMMRQELRERPKILVVGREDSFSRPLVDYAVGFAKRMGYEIVAMNCVPFGHEAPEVLQPFKEELCREFESRAAEGVGRLIRRATEEEVAWKHVVKFGSPDQCIREVHDEIRRMEFVLMEPEAGVEEGLEPAIPVFCLAK
jgi:hypothetical protein